MTEGVREGQQAPDFALRDQHGQTVTLSSFRGEKTVVLVFYPYAFSRVCSSELAEIRDNLDSLTSGDVEVLALSCDPMFTLRAFAEKDRLSFPLLSDFWPHGAVAESFGVFDAERGCSRRSTFIIDQDGVLRWSVHNEMPDARSLADYQRVLAGIRSETTQQ